ncbi:NnrS family protein [uncultured Paludibaculum sp.]|uniref:NnrS family protein n=1 Tax=uncultured Paludibaculum sp. TaxID=1765020 RepID=UPI002AAC25C2|nr:NnrS family protein [uncultured Paludibaculum sp.]
MADHGPVATETALQRLVTVYIVTGLLFLVLPGTLLGVWNLVSISGRHSLNGLSQSWLQAHGHAQIFGWIGTFIIGIGYYSLTKMGGLKPFAVSRGWLSWTLWSCGTTLRWVANVSEWNWRVLLPVSAAFQLAAFLIFFRTVSGHKRPDKPLKRTRIESWMKLVIASTTMFLLALLVNLVVTLALAATSSHPEIPHWFDQRFLVLAAWGFPVLAAWGFNARWLPVFLGLELPSDRGLLSAMAACGCGICAALFGQLLVATILLLIASILASLALNVFRSGVKPAKTLGVTNSFPYFVRSAYVWLLIAAVLGVGAAVSDVHGGIWGASRHALTVGFLATMVFAIGQRVLPAFSGMRLLFSTKLMFASLAVLNVGCLLRVTSEVPAYEHNLPLAWRILPVSALTELTAVVLFAVNLGITLLLLPPRRAEASAPGTMPEYRP